MNHLENLKKLFSKGFVENPLLETYEAGEIHISSGKIVASDTLITPDKTPFNINFPKGDFPVYIHKERQSECVAYADIIFDKNALPVKWELALCDDQKLTDLAEGEIFGFPVESGMATLMDVDAQEALSALEQDLFKEKDDKFLGIYEEFFQPYFYDANGLIDQFAIMKPYSDQKENIVAFEAGHGEGFYASYIGYSTDNKIVRLICEFIEIGSD